MENTLLYEIVGYVASALVAVSLTMTSILRLRLINLAGAAFFTLYGLLIGAYPVAAVNLFIVLIDLYYLYQMLSAREFFRLLEVRADSEYLKYFLNYYQKDIRRFLPGFQYRVEENPLVFFILRNVIPAGLLIGAVRDGNLYVQLDYAIPGYRDLKIARFIYQDNAQAFRDRGIHKVYTEQGARAHANYLERMGFRPDPAEGGLYCLMLDER